MKIIIKINNKNNKNNVILNTKVMVIQIKNYQLKKCLLKLDHI